MQVLSVNLGQAVAVAHGNKQVLTGIFKSPVDQPCRLSPTGFLRDEQADLRFHGGADKAAYAYPHEHYADWQAVLAPQELTPGYFGENLTTVGLVEREVHLGDVFRIGKATVQVSQPRVPCFKLGIRVGDPEFIKQFHQSRKSGFYLRVLTAGEVAAGDAVTCIERDPIQISIDHAYHMMFFEQHDLTAIRRVAEHPALSDDWKAMFSDRLASS